MAKFNKGDKVVLTKQAPKLIRDEANVYRTRTITEAHYDKGAKRYMYHVGTNKTGEAESLVSGYPFRSYYLKLVPKHKRAGRPKTKRKYRRRQ